MRVLGISPLDKDSTVTFLEDGRVLFACGEERLSRVKLQSGFPSRALAEGFARTGWSASSIDAIAYAFWDADEEARRIREAMLHDFAHPHDTGESCRLFRERCRSGIALDRSVPIPGLDTAESEFLPRKPFWKRWIYDRVAGNARVDARVHRKLFRKWAETAIQDHRRWNEELARGLKEFDLDRKPLRRFDHHDTHAANAFYSSPFDEALIVTLDGYGSGMCGGVFLGNREGLKPLHRFRFPNSLGTFYEQVTSGLGFKPNRHEGKIVGLAAYGNPRHLAEMLLARFETSDGDLRIGSALNHFFCRALSQHFSKRDIAAAYQFVLEEVTRRVVRYWIEKTGQTCIVLSGGVNANVKLNQRIREIPSVVGIFVYPNMGDGGCGTGAAMLATGHEIMSRAKGYSTVYFGPEFTNDQIRHELEREGLNFEHHNDIEDPIASKLADNFIVGRFHGRMEYGPRALGNRSVLYPAREPQVNQWLNQQLGRTEFMPFAPACLAEYAPQLFHNLTGCEKTAEFMTLTFDCTEAMKQHSPAAVHVDGTARPQLVTAQSNPSFHRVLKAYHDRTGIPVLINTSFNMHEEPIVCSPNDAVRAFLLGNLDYLAIGSYLVPHPKLERNIQDRRRMRDSELGEYRTSSSMSGSEGRSATISVVHPS